MDGGRRGETCLDFLCTHLRGKLHFVQRLQRSCAARLQDWSRYQDRILRADHVHMLLGVPVKLERMTILLLAACTACGGVPTGTTFAAMDVGEVLPDAMADSPETLPTVEVVGGCACLQNFDCPGTLPVCHIWRCVACQCVDSIAFGIACDTGNPCTSGTCNAAGICSDVMAVVGHVCDDQNGCTKGDQCTESGKCEGVTSCPPTSGNCKIAACEPKVGVCYLVPDLTVDGSACDDANACTTGETCKSGVCANGVAVICPAGQQCGTYDGCY